MHLFVQSACSVKSQAKRRGEMRRVSERVCARKCECVCECVCSSCSPQRSNLMHGLNLLQQSTYLARVFEGRWALNWLSSVIIIIIVVVIIVIIQDLHLGNVLLRFSACLVCLHTNTTRNAAAAAVAAAAAAPWKWRPLVQGGDVCDGDCTATHGTLAEPARAMWWARQCEKVCVCVWCNAVCDDR